LKNSYILKVSLFLYYSNRRKKSYSFCTLLNTRKKKTLTTAEPTITIGGYFGVKKYVFTYSEIVAASGGRLTTNDIGRETSQSPAKYQRIQDAIEICKKIALKQAQRAEKFERDAAHFVSAFSSMGALIDEAHMLSETILKKKADALEQKENLRKQSVAKQQEDDLRAQQQAIDKHRKANIAAFNAEALKKKKRKLERGRKHKGATCKKMDDDEPSDGEEKDG
jgi:hypothetical protein